MGYGQLRVEWLDHRKTIEDALRALPRSADWPGLFDVLVDANGGEKRVALVSDRDGPVGLVLLRPGEGDTWELATNWLVPGFLFPVLPNRTYEVLRALQTTVRVGWWRFPETPPAIAETRNFLQRPRHEITCGPAFDEHWRQSGNYAMLRQAQKRCKDFDLRLNPAGGAEWTIRKWEETWRRDAEHVLTSLADRLLAAPVLERAGRQNAHVLYDGDKPVAGATHLVHGDTVVASVLYRDPAYNRQGVGTYVIEAMFRWAAQAGYRLVDIGGGHAYKKLWAPETNDYTYEFVVAPATWRARARGLLKNVKDRWLPNTKIHAPAILWTALMLGAT